VGRLYPANITYQYTVQRGTQYRWELRDKWTPCDKVCNGESSSTFVSCSGQLLEPLTAVSIPGAVRECVTNELCS
jgi:hypothetical protein